MTERRTLGPSPRVLVLIPAYNEANSLPRVIDELHAQMPDADVLVVDDASTDETPRLLQELDVKWLRLSQRLGTGAAVKAGLRYATSLGYRVVVRVDGDGQHPANAIAQVLAPVLGGRADVAIGSRYATGKSPRTPWLRRLGHRGLGAILTLLAGRRVTDPTSGFWAFGPHALRVLAEHHPSGYPEPELVLFLSRNALHVVEVPVTMRDRIAGQTSLTPQRTGIAFARLLLLLVIVPLRSAVGGSHD